MSEWRLHWVEAPVVPVDVHAPDAPRDDAKVRARARVSKGTLADLISGKATYCRIRIDLPPESLVRGVRLLTVPTALAGFYPMADTLRVSGPPPKDAPKRDGSMVFYMAARSLLGLHHWRPGMFIAREKWERSTFLVPPKASHAQADSARPWLRAVRDELLLPNPGWRFGGSVIGGRKMTLNGFGEPDGVFLEYNGVECLELGGVVAAGLFVPRDAFAKVSYWARPWFRRLATWDETKATITRRAAEQIRSGELVGWGADGMRVIRR